MNNFIYDELFDGEQVKWEGMPKNKLFSGEDIYFIPFSLMWCAFSIFWEVSAFSLDAPLLFRLWGIPFVLIGLYMVFGRFFYKSYVNKRTFYYVTNKRIIIKKKLLKTKTTAINIDKIDSIEKNIKRNGEGTIHFGKSSWIYGMYTKTGMDFMRPRGYGTRNITIPPAFHDIDDAENVYRLIYSE